MTSSAGDDFAGGALQCPVCRSPSTSRFAAIDGRHYFRCAMCEATFLEPSQRPSPEEELAHYGHHENAVGDPGYRAFLARFAGPFLERLPAAMSGLDYGCGPGPALAEMLREAGQTVALYDPFYHADAAVLAGLYDFISCTETAEHFHDPFEEFQRLDVMLKPGGTLGVMTRFHTEDEKFARWHYRMDPTHVVFYRPATFRVIASQRGWACEIPAKDVVILRKPREVEVRG